MAELDPYTESLDSNESNGAPKKRQRRRAGAPAGAPAVEVQPNTGSIASQPRTHIAEQSASVVVDAQPLNLRAKRLAERAARAEAQEAETATKDMASGYVVAQNVPEVGHAEEETPQELAILPTESTEVTSEDSELSSQDAEVASEDTEPSSQDAELSEESDHPSNEAAETQTQDFDLDTSSNLIFADLQALASHHKDDAPEEAEPASAPDMLDFASLLFRAPTPGDEASHTTEEVDFAEMSMDVMFGAPDLEAARKAAVEKAERAAKRQAKDLRLQESEDETEETEGLQESEANDLTPGEGDSDDESKTSRRRRRRGGRGRRGRGRGEEDAVDSEESAEAEGVDDDSPTSAEETETDEEDTVSGSSRRRRRRRRSVGSGGDEAQPDDPPNTVVRVREARDEVKAVKGSTRLEAKKQRRKEGRESGRRRHSITESEFLARRESVKRSMIVRERPGRTQIVVLEDNILVEHYVAQKTQTSMVGNVYLGKVQNVLPSMEAAFVDIGKGRNAVLYAGEVNWDAAGLDGQPRRIELALKAGDPVLVQVTKDPIGHKGARLTSQISLPGRYLVYVPGGSMTGISRKLPDKERARLKKILKQIVPEEAGVIVRTAAEGASEEELTRDVERLQKQWAKIDKASSNAKNAPSALSTEPDLAIKVVRDIFNEDFTSLIVEGESVYKELHEYISNVAPDLLERVTKHVGTKDSFAKYRVDEQLMKAMDRKVYLPSGGSLVIDRTEAMTVVDVNTGKFTGSGGSLEETVTRNNLEAAEEIVRQLRLRDIGGIIVVDFIDMVLESNRDLVLRRMIECLSRDRTKHQVAEVTSLGLVQMTRKRVGAGLVETFSTVCEHCHGRGIQIDLDGQHHHEPPAFEDESHRGKRRRKRGAKSADSSQTTSAESRKDSNSKPDTAEDKAASAKDAVQDLVDSKNQSEIHRLEEDEQSRALARATIASIAAASSGPSHPEVTVDGQVIAIDDASDSSEAPNSTDTHRHNQDAADTDLQSKADDESETEASSRNSEELPESG